MRVRVIRSMGCKLTHGRPIPLPVMSVGNPGGLWAGASGHLEGIHQVFYEEEMPQLRGCRDHVRGDLLGQTFCLLPGQGQIHIQVGPKGTKECGVSQWVDGAQSVWGAQKRAINEDWGEHQLGLKDKSKEPHVEGWGQHRGHKKGSGIKESRLRAEISVGGQNPL